MCVAHQLDLQKSEQFAGRLLQIMNNGAISLMISIGHRTGLFDIMQELEPSTSFEIAEAAELNERYVREWLAAMTTMNILEYYPESATFSLPREHAGFLTRSAGTDNIAMFTQFISVLGSVEDYVTECFKNGGGVEYAKYKRFHDVMAEDSNDAFINSLTDIVLPEIDGLISRLHDGINAADMGCGKGKAIIRMAKIFPNSRFLGVDLSNDLIHKANKEIKQAELLNIRFHVQDLTNYHVTSPEEKYDLITAFDAIHDQARPDNVLKGIYKALKKDGIFLMKDISASSELQNNLSHPIAPYLYTISTMHCMTVSLAQGGLGLGTMWGREKAVQLLNEAGFRNIEIKNFQHDLFNDYYVIKK